MENTKKIVWNRIHILLSFFITFITPVIYGQEMENKDEGLAFLYEEGYILHDKNDDRVIDFVEVRIVLPEDFTNQQVVSAANIASRLGYETSGINMDFTGYDSERVAVYNVPVIIIGNTNKLLSRISQKSRINSRLAPGQGELFYIEPDDFFQKGGVLLWGNDATGLHHASNYLAGRFPSIWSVKGKALKAISGTLRKFLEERSLSYDSLHLSNVNVAANIAGVLKASVLMRTSTDSDALAILEALKSKEDEDDEDKKKTTVKDLVFDGLKRLEITIISPDSERKHSIINEKHASTSNKNLSHSFPDFSLSQFYSINGIFKDTNKDFVPDDMAAYFNVAEAESPGSMINLAARIGLESAGLRTPLFVVGGEDDEPQRTGFPIMYGLNNYYGENLRDENKMYGISGEPGEGFAQFVHEGFNKKNGMIVSGSDAEGLASITDYFAQKLPYLWEHGKGNFELNTIEKEVEKFFQIGNAASQVSVGVYKLREWLSRLEGADIESIDVELAAEEVPRGLVSFLENSVKNRFPASSVSAKTFQTGFGAGEQIFEEDFIIPWEVDDFWKIFNMEILPNLNSSSAGKIVVRVSESPGQRKKIKDKIISELRRKRVPVGAISVSVLSAYKQGYSWLYDDILPRIKNKNVKKIDIKYHNLKDSGEIKWQAVYANTRWLQELYPVDAIMAKELNIPYEAIVFHSTISSKPIYTVKVTDTSDKVILEDSFDPKYVVRPFFDLFPEYENVRVTTGWVTAELNGRILVDQRIKTDPERFWDHLQTSTYKKIIDYTMDIQDGRPSSAYAPYFDEFRVNLTLSEPNYRIGLDEEVISSTEALHEDIYFETLTLFNLLGSKYNAGSMNYPGRILPYIQPPVDGKAGKAKITLTGKQKGRPEIVFTYKERGKEPEKKRYLLRNLNVPAPKMRGIKVKAKENRVHQLLFEVKAMTPDDKYEEFKDRATEVSIDRNFVSAEKLGALIGILNELHNNGIFSDVLSYDSLSEMLFRITLSDSTAFTRLVTLPQSKKPRKTQYPRLYDNGFNYDNSDIVIWDEPISPKRNNEILAKLNTFPNVNVYFMSKSYLGQDVFAVDFYPPYETAFISQAKLNAQKPTLYISGRQHANEVSSTSHILRLAEKLATDTSYANMLKNVNLVVNPITNADGAHLAVEMYKTNPDFMLHAGYLGPLGVDIDADGRSSNPRYPESSVRRRIREAWLPDIYINMHGYPSHEWVQYFAGYSAWVRNRNGGQRSWWAPRGWFIPGFRWVEDSKFPDHKTAAFAILDSITSSIRSNDDVFAMSQRMYKVYRKYRAEEKDEFGEYFVNDILVNSALKGSKMSGSGVTNPRITYFSVTTEAPDETAYGDWLKLVASAGLSHSTALLNYLNTGENKIKNESEEYTDHIVRKIYRVKPVLPRKQTEDKK